MKWTHNALADDLASHVRQRTGRIVWTDMQLGPSGSPRPDVYSIEPSFAKFRPLAYEVKVSVADYRRDVAAGKYLETDDDGKLTSESVNFAWRKVGAIAKALSRPEAERKLLYIRGICRNRFSYCDDKRCLSLLKQAYEAGIDPDELAEVAKTERNWSNWQREMWRLIDEGNT